MTDTEKCGLCGRYDARRYTVTSPMFEVRTVYVCDVCCRRLFVAVDESREVLRRWDSERPEVIS